MFDKRFRDIKASFDRFSGVHPQSHGSWPLSDSMASLNGDPIASCRIHRPHRSLLGPPDHDEQQDDFDAFGLLEFAAQDFHD